MRGLAFPFCIVALLPAACVSDEPSVASPDVLKTTAFIRIADRIFAAPVAEVRTVTDKGDCNCVSYSPFDEDTGKRDAERLAQDAKQWSKPIEAGYVAISPGNKYDCVASPKSWQCRAKGLGIPDSLPQGFMIADTGSLKQFSAHFTVGGERVSDRLAAIAPINGKPKIACDKQSKFCTAAVALSPRVIAVWYVWPKDHPSETPMAMAIRQGEAISRVANGS